jgi:hypothetical protein
VREKPDERRDRSPIVGARLPVRYGLPLSGEGDGMRLLTVPAVVLVGLGIAAPAWAPPTGSEKSEVRHLVCEGTSVDILLSPGHGNSNWGVDSSGETDGTFYHLKSLTGRFYPGNLSEEPAGQDPAFTFSKTFGQRVGQGEPSVCETSFTATINGTTYTAFFDLMVTQR